MEQEEKYPRPYEKFKLPVTQKVRKRKKIIHFTQQVSEVSAKVNPSC